MRFEGDVALVTGAGRGIGRAAAIGFAAEGAKVVVSDLDAEPANEVVEEIKAAGGEAMAAIGSVTDRDYVFGAVEQAEAELGSLSIVVNNAGITNTSMALKMKPEQWQSVIDINLTGVFNCSQAAGEAFKRRYEANPELRCAGHVVNIASVAGLRGTMGQVNYGAAKAGVIGLTMSLAREWARFRVVANAIAFGAVETRMTETIRTDERFKAKLEAEILLGRIPSAEEVARSILFLGSPDADFITGQTLNVSGGLHIGF